MNANDFDPGDFYRAVFEGGVTGGTGAKTWTYSPEMSVTVSPRAGLRIALRLFWDSLLAMVHRDTVTFTAGQALETYSYEVDAPE